MPATFQPSKTSLRCWNCGSFNRDQLLHSTKSDAHLLLSALAFLLSHFFAISRLRYKGINSVNISSDSKLLKKKKKDASYLLSPPHFTT